MKLIGREELIDDPRFATGNDRVTHQKELDAIIGEWTVQHDKRAAMEKLIAVGCRPARCSTRWSCRTSRPSRSAA